MTLRQDVKDFADAMERGWKLAPDNCYGHFRFVKGSHDQVIACCAMGHAMLGAGVNPTRLMNDCKLNELKANELFPILHTQRVENLGWHNAPTQTLESAINDLMLLGWTTPRVINWLRSRTDGGDVSATGLRLEF